MVLTNGPSSKDYDVGETLRGLIKSRRLLHPIWRFYMVFESFWTLIHFYLDASLVQDNFSF
jgi:hypothetical protein